MSTVPHDPSSRFVGFAHPERLVSTEWLAEHLDEPGLVVVESNEDVLLYETGHIPGAVKVDWHTDLNDPVVRDYLDGESFARLMVDKGISRDDTIVFYGDAFNWWAAYALWVFSLFGHEDLRLLDGGRQAWIAQGRELTTARSERPSSTYPIVERDDSAIRAFRDDVAAHVGAGGRLVDVRSPEEYRGELLHMPGYPQEGSLRGGHIAGAANVPWKRAANENGSFRSAEELREIYVGEHGLDPAGDVIAYCRIGERSSHTWFVLHELLGYERVRNYDGSWTEWGSVIAAPIENPAAERQRAAATGG